MKKAFEGKLVPQDSTDEPADKLLERIKAEKTKRESKKEDDLTRLETIWQQRYTYLSSRQQT